MHGVLATDLFLRHQHTSDADLLQNSKHELGLHWIESRNLFDLTSELSGSASIQTQS